MQRGGDNDEVLSAELKPGVLSRPEKLSLVLLVVMNKWLATTVTQTVGSDDGVGGPFDSQVHVLL